MDDDAKPRLTRCFRGHATPAGKTFCESCGAALDAPAAAAPRTRGSDADGDVLVVPNRRRHHREAGDVVPSAHRKRIRFPGR